MPGIRYLITYACFAELSSAFGDAEAAAVVYQALLPYPDLFVCGGAGLTMLDGSVQRYLGLAALLSGGWTTRSGTCARRSRPTNAKACSPVRPSPPSTSPAPWPAGGVPATAEAAALAASAAGWRRGWGWCRCCARRVASSSLDGSAAGPLTRREGEIAALVARGLTNRQIAAALHISERTAENHVQHILTKLGLHTRTQIALCPGPSPGASPEP